MDGRIGQQGATMHEQRTDSDRSQLNHQCARCRQFTPLEPDEDPASAREWWVCRACRTVLLPDRNGTS